MKTKYIKQLIENWRTEGVITDAQAAHMRNDIDAHVSEQSGMTFISAIMYIGVTGLSLGALLFIASNWSYITKPVKVVMAVLLPVLPLAFAYWKLVMQKSERVLPQAANIFGIALIGGSIALIGQIYHLDGDPTSLLWSWALLSMPFVFAFQRRENVLLSVILLGSAIFMSILDFLDSTDIDEGAGILLLTAAVLGYAAGMYAIGSMLRHSTAWQESARLLRLSGGSIAATALFVTTFEAYAEIIVGYDANATVLSIVFNLFFIGFLVFALLRASKHQEYQFAFSVVRLFGFYLIVKYFTLFYSMFDTSLFFILGGIIFITGGWLLEKNKSALTGYMKTIEPHSSAPNTPSYEQQ